MIPTNELRIGNYITSKTLRFPCMVCSIGVNPKRLGIEVVSANELTTTIRDFEAEPIPLTEEMVLKCGFGEVGFYDNVYHLEYFRIYLDKKSNQGLLKYEDDNDTIEIEVESVHQLQNVYFALTGKELEISL